MLWLRVSSHMRSFWSDEALPRGRPRLAAQFFMLRAMREYNPRQAATIYYPRSV